MPGKTKVTKLRVQIPRGMKVEDVVQKLEISFEPAQGASPHFNTGNYCCVDVAVAGPFASISNNGGGGGDGDDTA